MSEPRVHVEGRVVFKDFPLMQQYISFDVAIQLNPFSPTLKTFLDDFAELLSLICVDFDRCPFLSVILTSMTTLRTGSKNCCFVADNGLTQHVSLHTTTDTVWT